MEPTQQSSGARMIAIGAVIVVAVLGIGYMVLGKKAAAPAENPVNATTTATETTPAAPATDNTGASTSGTGNSTGSTAAASTYKDGTYTATGSYQSPGGDEKMGVSLTLKDDVVTAVSITPEPVSAEGKRYQQMFADNVKQYVVGKKITDINLGTVSGSSLTPMGFMNALTQIEAKAKA